MTNAEPPANWSRAQRWLHWSVAAMVPTAFIVGLVMAQVPTQDLLAKFALFQFHKTIGLIVLALILPRLVLRWRRPRPSLKELPAWQASAARTVHALLYSLLVLTPTLGYLVAATAPARIPTLFLGFIPVPHVVGVSEAWFPILRGIHFFAASTLVALAALHAAAALYHHFHGSNIFRRMLMPMDRL